MQDQSPLVMFRRAAALPLSPHSLRLPCPGKGSPESSSRQKVISTQQSAILSLPPILAERVVSAVGPLESTVLCIPRALALHLLSKPAGTEEPCQAQIRIQSTIPSAGSHRLSCGVSHIVVLQHKTKPVCPAFLGLQTSPQTLSM